MDAPTCGGIKVPKPGSRVAFVALIGKCRLFDELSFTMACAFSVIARSHATHANPTGAFVGRLCWYRF